MYLSTLRLWNFRKYCAMAVCLSASGVIFLLASRLLLSTTFMYRRLVMI